MDWLQIIAGAIVAFLSGSGGAAVIVAWLNRRKTAAETDDTASAALLKRRQADVTAVEPWRHLVDQLQEQLDKEIENRKSQDEKIAKLAEVHAALRIVTEDRDKAVEKNVELRKQVQELLTEVGGLRDGQENSARLIKQLTSENAALKAEIADLRNENADFRKRLASLEKRSTGPLASGAPAP